MNFKPLTNHLFLEPIEEEKTTASGIVLPDTAEKEKPVKAKVIAVGPGKKNEKGVSWNIQGPRGLQREC